MAQKKVQVKKPMTIDGLAGKVDALVDTAEKGFALIIDSLTILRHEGRMTRIEKKLAVTK